jgi:flagella basal body P-ring formation protein FlgA
MKLLVLLTVLAAPAMGRADPLEDRVADQIRGTIPAELALVSLTIAAPASVRAAAAAAGPTIVWRGAARAGIATVGVNAGPHRLWARVELRAVAQVVVARRALRAMAVVNAGDLAVEGRPVEPGQGLTVDPAFLVGASVARDVPAGTVVRGTDLVLPAPIARGTEVKIVVPVGPNARITTSGVLERAARPGEATAARLDGRLIPGRLVDATTFVVTRGAR